MPSRRESLAAPPARVAEAAPRASVGTWLLHGPAQLAHGRHAGAIAGTVTGGGDAAYVYPEIAGYYLQWLAWRAQRHGRDAVLCARATALQRWLGVWLADGDPPATRVHLDGTTADWRNRAVFFFDVAMVLRGLGSAADAGLIAPEAGVVAGVVRQLERVLAADGLFDACAMTAPDDVLPPRWSTRRGAFLAKAAAGVLTAARVLPDVPERIVRAADDSFIASAALLAQEAHREAHPLLYAFEGVLGLPRHRRFHAALPMVATHFDALLATAGADGYLPETMGVTDGPQRVDVLAQALRVGHLLSAHRPQRPPDRIALERMARALAHEVRATGAVAFARGADGSQANVWAAMFADQAQAFAIPLARTGGADDEWWRTDPLLV
jgi:hypothetical protein